MAALTALALAAGIGSSIYGAVEGAEGRSQQAAGLAQQQAGYQIQQQAAQQQAAISKAQAAASVGFAGQERDISIGASNQSKAVALASQSINRGIFTQQSNIQGYQRQAMETDARRSNLEQIRNEQRARSISLATGVAQGGSGYVSGSSARGGAYGGISGQGGTNLLANQQSLLTGENVFAANANISQSNIQMNNLQTQYALQQADTMTAKSNLAYGYAQSNAAFQTQTADTQTLMASGQGQVSIGGGVAQAGALTSQMGASFMSAGPSIFNAGVNMNQLMGGLPSFNFMFAGNAPTGYGSYVG
jgi:hypothetical protein